MREKTYKQLLERYRRIKRLRLAICFINARKRLLVPIKRGKTNVRSSGIVSGTRALRTIYSVDFIGLPQLVKALSPVPSSQNRSDLSPTMLFYAGFFGGITDLGIVRRYPATNILRLNCAFRRPHAWFYLFARSSIGAD